MGRAKVTVTIDEDLIADLDRLTTARKESRSRLVEDAIRSWRRTLMEQQLAEGYRAMARENAQDAEFCLAASVEALK